MPIFWQILKDHIIELTPDRVSHLENILVRETLKNDAFMKQLEGSLKAALRNAPKG